MQTRKIKGGITPKKSKSNKSKKKSSSNKSKKYPTPPFSTLIFDNPLFESRTELKEKYTSLIQKFEDLNEPYNSLEPKIEKIKNVSFDILNGSYGEINQPNNKKYIPEVIEGIQKRYANIKNQIKNDVDNKFIEIKQEVEYITTYINKKYGDKTIFEKKTVVEGIIKNIHEINEKIDILHNKIADFHNYIDNLKTEIDNLNTGDQ
jgi:polyhydroxyalkanoate synthesis regulator phasin